ncbi:hypothetical protein [Ignatzschineria ureiclastica]|uniref:hypothetical protein n=1 Tax=Ignatzschineria ureiclastica TaxID=472582 RepID=UPI00130096B9|nr:hypothetical protein [Ignatzschineria ureiclastica]
MQVQNKRMPAGEQFLNFSNNPGTQDAKPAGAGLPEERGHSLRRWDKSSYFRQ